jgi:hypothetical protein
MAMTKIANTHQTRATSQDCRAESAPENIGEKKLLESRCSIIPEWVRHVGHEMPLTVRSLVTRF